VPFLEKFKGHDEGISLVFVQTYDGENVHLEDVKLTIIEATIAEATCLPMAREKYFKRVIIDKNFVKNSSSQNITTPIGPKASLEATSKKNIGRCL
jgi:hypothetical protein